MLAAILGFFTALPDLLKLIQSAMAYVNQVSGNNPAGWAAQVSNAFTQLKAAQTPQEKTDAAKSIADLFAGS